MQVQAPLPGEGKGETSTEMNNLVQAQRRASVSGAAAALARGGAVDVRIGRAAISLHLCTRVCAHAARVQLWVECGTAHRASCLC